MERDGGFTEILGNVYRKTPEGIAAIGTRENFDCDSIVELMQVLRKYRFIDSKKKHDLTQMNELEHTQYKV